MTLKQELEELKALVKKGLEATDVENYCDDGRAIYSELSKKVGYNPPSSFADDDFHMIHIEELDMFKFSDAIIEDMRQEHDVIDFDDGLRYLNERLTEWRIAILDDDDVIVAEQTRNGGFVIPE